MRQRLATMLRAKSSPGTTQLAPGQWLIYAVFLINWSGSRLFISETYVSNSALLTDSSEYIAELAANHTPADGPK